MPSKLMQHQIDYLERAEGRSSSRISCRQEQVKLDAAWKKQVCITIRKK